MACTVSTWTNLICCLALRFNFDFDLRHHLSVRFCILVLVSIHIFIEFMFMMSCICFGNLCFCFKLVQIETHFSLFLKASVFHFVPSFYISPPFHFFLSQSFVSFLFFRYKNYLKINNFISLILIIKILSFSVLRGVK